MNNRISIPWAELKTIQAAKSLPWQFLDFTDRYWVYLVDGVSVYQTILWKVPGALAGGMPSGMDADRADFEAIYKDKCNLVSTSGPRVDGRPQASMFPTEGASVNLFSHNWGDRTTWYTQSVLVTSEVATDSGDHILYNLAHPNVVDVSHGKLTAEDELLDSAGNNYKVAVTVDGVAKVENDAHTGVGDYTVNYSSGAITFGVANSGSAVVSVTYHYEAGSAFIIAPAPGKRLRLKRVEVQFSDNIDILDTMTFLPFGYVDVFAPQLMPGVPSGTKIQLSSGTTYKTMLDYINESNGAQPKIVDLGGSASNWRSSQSKIVILVWDYMTMDTISSQAGMEIRVALKHDSPFGSIDSKPAFAVSTFYCLSEDDV